LVKPWLVTGLPEAKEAFSVALASRGFDIEDPQKKSVVCQLIETIYRIEAES
jgi:hypothetical protein